MFFLQLKCKSCILADIERFISISQRKVLKRNNQTCYNYVLTIYIISKVSSGTLSLSVKAYVRINVRLMLTACGVL